MKKILQIIFLIHFSVFISQYSFSQKPKPSVHIKKATSKINIDGILDEPDWQTAEPAKDFFQNFPADTSYALTKTEVFVTYDDENFYVAAICYDEVPGDYIIQSLKRDFSYPLSDAFTVYIDPFCDKTNGFCFGVNPLGAQREGVLEGGGVFGVTTNWDNRWLSEVKKYDGKWIVEMAIPFKSVRYKEDISLWGINFSRNDLKRNENSSWAAVPRVYNIGSLAYAGDLIWDSPPPKAGANISVIPYVIGSASRDFTGDSANRYKPNAGMDAKVAVTSSLNLDLTFNPDFSQVEVDRQVTNLTRFNLFFPERRQFFIENSDLFSQFGFRQIRPFFSRRIGLAEKNGLNYSVPIIAGARLSGKADENWRIGAMNIQTARDSSLGLEAQNYSVAAFQRQVFSRSNIAGVFVNRQGFRGNDMLRNDFNRIAGIDYNLASANNEWFGKFFFHKSFQKIKLPDDFAHASFLLYNTRTIFIMWNHEYVGKNYIADAGFVPRTENYDALTGKIIRLSYWRFEPSVEYKFYPKSKFINYHGPGIYSSVYLDSAFRATESFTKAYYLVKFENTSEISVEAHKHFTKLFFPVDVLQTGGEPLPANHYHYNMFRLNVQSNQRKKLNAHISGILGEFYNGWFAAGNGEIFYRIQPYGILGINYSIDDIHLPAPYSNATLFLVGPSVELSFTKSLFFTTFVQYNTQLDNVNINSRIQWRFKPMSDVFVVYSDNYDLMLGKKNHALVLKLVYWFTV